MILALGRPSVNSHGGSASPPKIERTEEERRALFMEEAVEMDGIVAREMEMEGRGGETLCQGCYARVLAGGACDPACACN
jgi:hypothetical protein